MTFVLVLVICSQDSLIQVVTSNHLTVIQPGVKPRNFGLIVQRPNHYDAKPKVHKLKLQKRTKNQTYKTLKDTMQFFSKTLQEKLAKLLNYEELGNI